MAILQCENLCFAYDGSTVLEGVNFSLKAGSYLCIVGENGSGKSTLMKGLLGLKAPDGGHITFGEGLASRARRSDICPNRRSCSGISRPASGR